METRRGRLAKGYRSRYRSMQYTGTNVCRCKRTLKNKKNHRNHDYIKSWRTKQHGVEIIDRVKG